VKPLITKPRSCSIISGDAFEVARLMTTASSLGGLSGATDWRPIAAAAAGTALEVEYADAVTSITGIASIDTNLPT
jgi:hypothetical protein